MQYNYDNTSPYNPIRWFLDTPVAVTILMIAIIIGGGLSLSNLQRSNMPDITLGNFVIHVPVNSGSAEDVERTIVSKIEEAISGIEGIDKIVSSATANLGSVRVEVLEGYDMSKVRDDATTQVDAIATFPRDAEEPYIFEVDGTEVIFGNTVIQFNISGQRNKAQLSELAELLRSQLLDQKEITDVEISGIPTEEISIEVSEENLQTYQLNLDDVVSALRNYSVDRTGGTIKKDSGFMQLRVRKERRSGVDFGDIPIISLSNGQEILLRDIATINDGYIESLAISKLNGLPSVGIQIKSTSSQDILAIKAAANSVADTFELSLDDDLRLDRWLDQTTVLQERLSLVIKNGLLGLILVLILLSLFLDLKLAFWVAVGIPIAFLGALFAMPFANTSINYVSTFGFIVALGIVVDDAIIVSESVHRSVETKGPGLASVFYGTSKVAISTTFGVLTTMAAFLPLILLSGVFGDILGELGMVVILCFIFSLIESKLILPSHLRHLRAVKQADPNLSSKNRLKKLLATSKQSLSEKLNRIVAPWEKMQGKISQGLEYIVKNKYLPFIRKAIKYRYITLSVFIAILILTVSLIPGGQVKTSFFPDLEDNRMVGSIEMVEGTPYALTYRALEQLENSLEEAVAEFTGQNVNSVDVSSVVKNISYVSNSEKTISFRAELDIYQGKEVSPGAFSKIWQRKLGSVPGVKTVNMGSDGGPTSADVIIRLESRNLDDLKLATIRVEEAMRQYSQVIDTSNNLVSAQPELQFTTNALAKSLGLNEAEIIRQVRQAVFGAEVQRIQRGREETRVYVRYPKSERDNLSLLDNLRIRTRSSEEIPLSSLVYTELAPGITQINRVDGRRAAFINVNVIDKISLGIIEQAFTDLAPDLLADIPSVSFALDGQANEQIKTVASLKSGMLVSMLLIFTLLALPLNSYAKPLIILSVIPFSLIGVILGHYILGYYISLPSFLGTLALFGVVVNDSLVLTTTINYHQDRGQSLPNAIESSVRERFRPILLTSITTFAGLAPLLIEASLSAEFLKPMAISLGYGILFTTAITLVLVPVIFRILADIRPKYQEVKKKVDLDSAESIWV